MIDTWNNWYRLSAFHKQKLLEETHDKIIQPLETSPHIEGTFKKLSPQDFFIIKETMFDIDMMCHCCDEMCKRIDGHELDDDGQVDRLDEGEVHVDQKIIDGLRAEYFVCHACVESARTDTKPCFHCGVNKWHKDKPCTEPGGHLFKPYYPDEVRE